VPGAVQGLYLIVSDIEAAREELLARGVEISGAFHADSGVYDGTDEPFLFGRRRDPTVTNFVSINDLAGALQRAAAAHGQLEGPIRQVDKNWSHWCAEYMVREQTGEGLPD
jgi:hypothetical protein